MSSIHLQITEHVSPEAIKASGATYTPKILADFLALEILKHYTPERRGTLHVLDPAVGDGALLLALLNALTPAQRKRVVVHGYDTNGRAIVSAQEALAEAYPGVQIDLRTQDFLGSNSDQKYDVVIANPPYVRTQVLGAERAQKLASAFGLSGRVDLYYAFLVSVQRRLADDGVMGVITSNRFLTTKSGASVRSFLQTEFSLRHIWDLGDTKLFGAAVLPAITIARAKGVKADTVCFSDIYEGGVEAAFERKSAIDALSLPSESTVSVGNTNYMVRHGCLAASLDSEDIWRLSTDQADRWLAAVENNTWAPFGAIGKVRVGIKTTADDVFIRSDWSSLESGEPELLLPLITRRCAAAYLGRDPRHDKLRILYTHYADARGKKLVHNLEDNPKAKAYLHSHRERLEGRSYVIKAKRKWYEIWVPQRPDLWILPKLIFPDISYEPVAWVDTTGAPVNGDCYYITPDGGQEELLWLALAVANSKFIGVYYDRKFNNKLYAGRRRFISQYVEKFPLPDPKRKESQEIITLAKQLHGAGTSVGERNELVAAINGMVWRVFGLAGEEILA